MDEFIRMVESNDPNALRRYLVEQIGLEMKSVFDKLVEEELNGLLKGDGGYLVSLGPIPSLLDFSSMHPSMGYRSLKPRNHYERMMARRKCGQRKTRRTR